MRRHVAACRGLGDMQEKAFGTIAVPPLRAAPPRQSAPAPAGRFSHYLARSFVRLAPVTFAAAVLAGLAVAWIHRDEGHITPELGLGYWLGIAGATMMLLLLAYPLRKRFRLLRILGTVPSWFRLHMVFGVLGPALVVVHTNFRLSALNSTVALASMLLVVASGIVGRYLHAKVHKGLYGSAAHLGEMLADADVLRRSLPAGSADADALFAELRALEARAVVPEGRLPVLAWRCLTVSLMLRAARRPLIRRACSLAEREARRRGMGRMQARRHVRGARARLRLYFAVLRKAARLALFARLLALWHVLHLPLFLLLIITAAIHVLAVHLY